MSSEATLSVLKFNDPGGADRVIIALEAVMNSISNGLGMRNTGTSRKSNRPWNPHFYAIFTQVHNTL
jgi:hypothetical protein